MTRHPSRGRFLAAATVVLACASPVRAQPEKPIAGPPPAGQRIEAHDGDTIVVRDGGRVRVVRRSEANVRAIYNATGRWVVLLVDYVDPARSTPDGIVDSTYRFNEVDGVWPLGERWEGSAVVDDYAMLRGGNSGVGLTTSAGFVQLFGHLGAEWFRDVRAVGMSYKGAGQTTSAGGRLSFAEAERHAVDEAARNAEAGASRSTSTTALPNGSTARMGMTLSAGPASPYPPSSAPVRVGSTLATPAKLLHAAAVWPEVARQAGVTGVVILEVTIGADGTVTDARILRSIPLLDKAALDAVRQWRYEPTLVNGAPVPVIMTVTVAFP